MTMAPQRYDSDSGRPVAKALTDSRGNALFGIPVGKLGPFASLLVGVASGFAAFFLATFLAIVTLLVINSAGHPLDYAYSYRRIGLPVGVAVGIFVLSYLSVLWVRRKFAHN